MTSGPSVERTQSQHHSGHRTAGTPAPEPAPQRGNCTSLLQVFSLSHVQPTAPRPPDQSTPEARGPPAIRQENFFFLIFSKKVLLMLESVLDVPSPLPERQAIPCRRGRSGQREERLEQR